jgi:hypothetical protein
MEALPEQLRFDLEILSALRGTFKYQGPTRQLRLIDNPVNSLLILSARNLGLQRENQRLGVACFKAMLEAGRSESVAKQAEERAAQAERSLYDLAVFSIQNAAEMAETIRVEREEKQVAISVIKMLIRQLDSRFRMFQIVSNLRRPMSGS